MIRGNKHGGSDECYTPKYIFDALGCEFDLDVAATKSPFSCVPTKEFIYSNSLDHQWFGFIWMNPPYSGGDKGKTLWLDKLYLNGNGIALMPDRTSAPWHQKAQRLSDAILNVNGKIKFINERGEQMKQPSNGSTLFAYGPRAVQALRTAEKNGLGKFYKNDK